MTLAHVDAFTTRTACAVVDCCRRAVRAAGLRVESMIDEWMVQRRGLQVQDECDERPKEMESTEGEWSLVKTDKVKGMVENEALSL